MAKTKNIYLNGRQLNYYRFTELTGLLRIISDHIISFTVKSRDNDSQYEFGYNIFAMSMSLSLSQKI
jgi:hypothetical protein